MPKTSKIETFIGYLRRRPAMTMFLFFCIGAGLVLGGVFISKVLSPIRDVTTTTKSVQTTFSCSTYTKRKYDQCVNKLMPLRNHCQDFLERGCSEERFVCENACFPKYNDDLKSCPCQVRCSALKIRSYFVWSGSLRGRDWLPMSQTWLLGSQQNKKMSSFGCNS